MLQKYNLLLFICLINITLTFSQRIDTLIIQRQTQIDSISYLFPDSIVTPHVILIEGTNIQNLKQFSQIRGIEGHLLIRNTNIDNLVGLENLKTLYSIHLENNLKLQSISKFNFLRQTSFVMIIDCPLLATLDFISNLESVGNLEIYGNTQHLKKIGDFPLLKQLNTFALGFNIGVDSVRFSDSLGILDVSLINNEDLLFFSASNIVKNSIIKEDENYRCFNFIASENKKLNYFNTGNNTPCFDWVDISSNPELKTFEIGEFSDSLIANFKIERNSKLETFKAFNNIKISGVIEIGGNDNLKELNCFKNLKNALS